MRTVSHWGGGGECFDIPTPCCYRVVISRHLWSHDLQSVVSAHVCKIVELFSVVLTCKLDILAKWTVFYDY